MSNSIKKRIVKHLLFWVGVFLFYIFSATNYELFRQTFETSLLKLPLLMIAAYAFNYWQVPYYLNKSNYIGFGLSLIFVLFLLILLFRIIGYNYLDQYCDYGPYPLISLIDFPLYMASFHFPAMIMYFYKMNKKQVTDKEKLLHLEKQKITTELKYLKAQLNPHFLFNTLNNLYSFVVRKSSKAPEMVLQLSEMLDYILYKSQLGTIALKHEIHTIENYIALEKVKYEDRLKVSFEKRTTDEHQLITPLLLLSIVENAFKHGVSGNITKPLIAITLEQKNKQLLFIVWNTKPNSDQNKTDTYKSGIGLSNIRRQLDLVYPDKHSLEINESDTHFEIKLILETT